MPLPLPLSGFGVADIKNDGPMAGGSFAYVAFHFSYPLKLECLDRALSIRGPAQLLRRPLASFEGGDLARIRAIFGGSASTGAGADFVRFIAVLTSEELSP